MPVADYQTYRKMLETAYRNKFAFPAINISSIESANAALEGFAEARSDGIIQISVGGGEHASGAAIRESSLGAISLANHIHLVADHYPVYVALHTDHCKPDKLDTFLTPLIAETEKRRRLGRVNLFQSHMFDGSELPLQKNLDISRELFKRCMKNDTILEIEIGVVGGEEDGVNTEEAPRSKLYTTTADMLKVYRSFETLFSDLIKMFSPAFSGTDCLPDAKSPVRYLLAATFGNVHGVYKPGMVKLNPKILKNGQDAVKKEFGSDAHFYLVFHGGSGSTKEEIIETLEYGVVKMNIDTDTQYAFTRPIADHMLKNYDSVLKVNGEVGKKKAYDPRSYLKAAEHQMAQRVIEACRDLRSEGKTIFIPLD